MANINESQDVETAGGSNFDDRHRPASGGGSKAPVRVPNRLISSIKGNNRLSSVFPYSLLENMCIQFSGNSLTFGYFEFSQQVIERKYCGHI